MPDARGAIEAVWRIEAANLIARLVRMVRDVALAEDLAQDALVAALEEWPRTGVPAKPGAWLLTAARNRGIDRMRRDKLQERHHERIARELERPDAPSAPGGVDEEGFGDDLLRLMFMTCHPALSMEARVALTLRLLGGLTTDEIARAFLVPEATVAQRIVRAKRTLEDHRATFDDPAADELADRYAAVLDVLYLVFNEGYSPASGDRWVRPELCEEAMRLGRVLAELAPDRPEAHGLIALMELQASRLRARVDAAGTPILLADQNRARWDGLLIQRGLAALERARRLGGAPDPYVLQAEIAACHARARAVEDTDWVRIAMLYGVLGRIAPSPIVELNRAVAIGMADGPAAALELVERLADEPALRGYHLLPSVRADLLIKLGRTSEARVDLERAASMVQNEREREILLGRAARLSRD